MAFENVGHIGPGGDNIRDALESRHQFCSGPKRKNRLGWVRHDHPDSLATPAQLAQAANMACVHRIEVSDDDFQGGRVFRDGVHDLGSGIQLYVHPVDAMVLDLIAPDTILAEKDTANHLVRLNGRSDNRCNSAPLS